MSTLPFSFLCSYQNRWEGFVVEMLRISVSDRPCLVSTARVRPAAAKGTLSCSCSTSIEGFEFGCWLVWLIEEDVDNVGGGGHTDREEDMVALQRVDSVS